MLWIQKLEEEYQKRHEAYLEKQEDKENDLRVKDWIRKAYEMEKDGSKLNYIRMI